MQSPAVLGALEMGFDKMLIMQLVKKKIEVARDTYKSVDSLVGDLLAPEVKPQDQEHYGQKEGNTPLGHPTSNLLEWN